MACFGIEIEEGHSASMSLDEKSGGFVETGIWTFTKKRGLFDPE